MGEQFVLATEAPENETERFERFHAELVGYYQEMKQFNRMDSVEVFERLSAWTARASEIRHSIVRNDSRRSTSFRTKQLEPFIKECDRQFTFHSRITAVHEMDLKLAGGRFT